MSDTICAPATAPGEAAIAIVRVSGPRARDVLGRLFRPRNGEPHLTPWRLHVGRLVDQDGATIDECLAAFMAAPKSYTGEDLCELHLHGGGAVVERALELALAAGARLAQPGEFTRRAYLAGKLDLAQAEAVAELTRASSAAAARLASAQLLGGLSRRVEGLRAALADLLAQAEAAIDFPEDDTELAPPALVAAALREGPLRGCQGLLDACRAATNLREGVAAVICGRPNVGKSTLLNALLGRERALTSPEPGTTRDFIEEGLEIGGVSLRLIDTAGLRSQAPGSEALGSDAISAVEAAGVALARERLANCGVALAVLDANLPARADDAALAADLEACPHVVVLNKADLPQRLSEGEARRLFPRSLGLVRLSALSGEGLEGLRRLLEGVLAPEAAPEVAPNLRHREALLAAREAMQRALEAVEGGLPAEVWAGELRLALDAVGAICGQTATDEILERIFSRFCLGK